MGYNSKNLIKLLESNGFRLLRIAGSHHMYFKKGIGVIPVPHPKKNMAVGTYKSILKKAGLK
jgi:predicted RNA binding protein YcfA (HicA-like mRNA interferase family)